MPGLVLGIRLVLAVVLAAAGVAKLADFEGSRRSLRAFGVPGRAATTGGVALPLLELGVAGCLLLSELAWWGLAAATGLLALFAVVVAVTMARGAAPDCHCFGRLHSKPVGWRVLMRNIALAAVAAAALSAGRGASRLSPVGWLGSLTAAELTLAAVSLLLACVVTAQGWLLVELLRRHGRILQRLDALQDVTIDPPAAVLTPRNRAGTCNGGGHRSGSRAEGLAPDQRPRLVATRLSVGSLAPALGGRDLDGRQISLSQLLGATVVLLFWNPACGFCRRMLPALREWESQHKAGEAALLLVSAGTSESNRAMGLRSPIMLDQTFAIARSFGASGTPSAVRIGVDGRVQAPLTVGAPGALRLLHGASGDLAAAGTVEQVPVTA